MGKGAGPVIGYRYSFGIHMGLNRGAVDEILAIKVGDRVAWEKGQHILPGTVTFGGIGNPEVYAPEPGDPGVITAAGDYYIYNPELFGGDKGEGGINGKLTVLMGGPSQTAPADLAAMLGGLVPGFRGVTTLFYDGLVTTLNPYPKKWALRRRRVLQGWDGSVWNSADALISLESGAIGAMNAAHILYESWTNRDWGRGLSVARLDLTAFGAAADTFLAEGFGLCLRWTRQDSIQNFQLAVLDHVGAAMYPDRTSGLIKLVPIRDDYDPNDLPLFTRDNGLLGIDDDDNAAQSAAVNEVIVKFRHPIDNTEGQIRAQNLASIQTIGKVTATTEYPGLPTAALAARVAQRDLRAQSGFIKRFKCRFDRRAYEIEPASLFRVSDPARGIVNIVLRAGRIEEGQSGDDEITIRALQDVFGLPATSFVSGQASEHTPPNYTPTVIATRKVAEAPYRELARGMDPANLAAVDDLAGFLAIFAAKPTSLSLGYLMMTRVGASGDFTGRGDGFFSPTGTLVGALSITGTSATIENAIDLDTVQPGTAAQIDDEIIRVDSINATTGAITFARGCADTVPAAHALGARVWFYDQAFGEDQTEYADGNAVYVKLLTRTSTGMLAEGSAGTDNFTMDQRHFRAYPPGNLEVNGSAYPASITGDLALTWAHRDRLTQADQLVDTGEADIGPEAGVTYTVRIFGGAGMTLKRTVAGLTGTSYTYANVDEVADGGPFDPIRFTLHAVRDSLESRYGHDWTVTRT